MNMARKYSTSNKMMSATLNTEQLVDVDDEIGTNQRKKNMNPLGDQSSVRVLVLQYEHIQTYVGNQPVKV